MTDEDRFEDITPEEAKISDVTPTTGAWYDPNHPLHQEELSEMEEMRPGDIWGEKGRKFNSLSEEELAQRVAEAREKENKSAAISS